jgi:response regulator RpfG family c-di-GMP phosphodiesterase
MKKVLFVDDDPDILALFERQFRKQFAVETALGPSKGLAALQSGGTYGVLVSDMTMPEMNGVEFLRRAREMAPDTVRLMLTGNADQATAAAAVNEGCVFRFLSKPCHPQTLAAAIDAAQCQYDLVVGERDLLEKTLNGCVQVLSEIISLIDPQGFGRSRALRETAMALARAMAHDKVWEVEMAAMLSLIGTVAIPPTVVLKARLGKSLSLAEQSMVDRVPEISSQLLGHVPRLESVARIVLYRDKHYDGSGFPLDDIFGRHIPLGARVLKVAYDLTHLEADGLSPTASLERLRGRTGWYDPEVLDSAASLKAPVLTGQPQPVETVISISFRELTVGQLLLSDIETRQGMLIVSAGNIISPALLERLRNFALVSGIREPIKIQKPAHASRR